MLRGIVLHLYLPVALIALGLGVSLPESGDDDPSPAPEAANPPGRLFIVPTDALTPEGQQASFTVPPGFEVQLVASEPEIQKPIQLAFDERGRLLVSTSTGYPLGPGQDALPSDKVMLLEIDGASGRAVKVTTFADGLDIPTGVEALPGGRVLLGHAPDILLLTDTDGDGRADTRDVLYSGFARDDTHELPNSFTWGEDGWVYALQGHANSSQVKDRTGRITEIKHGNVFRFRPDGSAIEVFAPGMSNPWGLVFDNRGNLFACDCESRPLWQIVRGFQYQGFNQTRDPLGFAPHITDDPHGASGFAGLAYYSAAAYPLKYRDCLYLANPLTSRIHRDRPEGGGSTFHAIRKYDFLLSSDPWFRPVDVELGPDGALYVADWYNKIIAHVEVPLDHPQRDKSRGRIWRIVYRGPAADGAQAAAIARQDAGPLARNWAAASRKELIAALSEPQAWPRRMASNQLAHHFGAKAARPLRAILKDPRAPALQRVEALHLLERLGALEPAAIQRAAGDPDAVVRTHAARLAAREDPSAGDKPELRALLLGMLGDPSAIVVREAVLSLCRMPDTSSLEALLLRPPPVAADDPLLGHGVRYSIREHLKNPALLAHLDTLALAPEQRVDLLTRVPSAESARLLAELIGQEGIPPHRLFDAMQIILTQGEENAIRTAIAGAPAAGNEGSGRAVASVILSAGQRAGSMGIDLGPAMDQLAVRLGALEDPQSIELAMEMALLRGHAALRPLAERVLPDANQTKRARRHAANLLMRLDPAATSEKLRVMLRDSTEELHMRRSAVEILAYDTKTPEALDALLELLQGMPRSLYDGAVTHLIGQKPGIHLLFDAVRAGRLNPSYLAADSIAVQVSATYNDAALLAAYRELVANADAPEAEERALVSRMAAAYSAHPVRDVRNGQILFEQNCMVCHRMGGVGGLRAPNLDGLGNRGLERVLQDVILPSQDIDPAFRASRLSMKDGGVDLGLVVEKHGERLVLLDREGREKTIPLEQIAGMEPVWVSPMPSGLATALPEDGFLDLIGFLLNPPAKIVRITAPVSAEDPYAADLEWSDSP